ncbi:hypothetical protein Rs2_50687 [Raphanus sativus]|nr:hypothetical protein Rs2_50687 [Raphanus sativus]
MPFVGHSPPPPIDFPRFDVMLLHNKILINTRIIPFQLMELTNNIQIILEALKNQELVEIKDARRLQVAKVPSTTMPQLESMTLVIGKTTLITALFFVFVDDVFISQRKGKITNQTSESEMPHQ